MQMFINKLMCYIVGLQKLMSLGEDLFWKLLSLSTCCVETELVLLAEM